MTTICLLPLFFASVANAEKAATRSNPQILAVDVDGDLADSRVEKIAEQSLPRLRPCFSKAAKSGDALFGSLQLRLLVLPNGRVTSATTESAGSTREGLRRCLQNKAMDIRFPQSKKKAHTTVRLTVGDKNTSSLVRLIGSKPAGIGQLFGSGGSGAGIFRAGKIHGLGTTGGVLMGKTPGGPGASGASPVSVDMPTPVVHGPMDSGLIRRTAKRHLNQIRFCYMQGLARNTNLAGRMTVDFVIGASGRVSTARVVSSTIGDTQMEQCVLGRVRLMRFPAPSGGGVVTVSYPFNFSANP